MGFFSVLITILIVFWLAGFIFRLALQTWLIKQQKRFTQNFNQYSNNRNNQKTRPEGTVEVQQTAPQNKKTVDKQIGEYIEFEEEK